MTTDLPDRMRTWAELDRIEAKLLLRADLNEAADEIDRLRSAIAKAANELAGDHKGTEHCRICWPEDGGWPCVTRAVADDLRALTGAALVVTISHDQVPHSGPA